MSVISDGVTVVFSTHLLFLLLGEECRNVIGKGLPPSSLLGFLGFLRSLLFLIKPCVLALSIGCSKCLQRRQYLCPGALFHPVLQRRSGLPATGLVAKRVRGIDDHDQLLQRCHRELTIQRSSDKSYLQELDHLWNTLYIDVIDETAIVLGALLGANGADSSFD